MGIIWYLSAPRGVKPLVCKRQKELWLIELNNPRNVNLILRICPFFKFTNIDTRENVYLYIDIRTLIMVQNLNTNLIQIIQLFLLQQRYFQILVLNILVE